MNRNSLAETGIFLEVNSLPKDGSLDRKGNKEFKVCWFKDKATRSEHEFLKDEEAYQANNSDVVYIKHNGEFYLLLKRLVNKQIKEPGQINYPSLENQLNIIYDSENKRIEETNERIKHFIELSQFWLEEKRDLDLLLKIRQITVGGDTKEGIEDKIKILNECKSFIISCQETGIDDFSKLKSLLEEIEQGIEQEKIKLLKEKETLGAK